MSSNIYARDGGRGYWDGRPKVDDDGNEIPDPSQELFRDENGKPTDFQEITGYESNEHTNEDQEKEVAQYPDEWDDIARKVKEKRHWRCEMCGFTSPGSAAIQLHHIDHDKADNSIANLQVLCLTCHKAKHGSGDGMGQFLSLTARNELDEWHRGAEAMRRLRLLKPRIQDTRRD